MQAINLLPAKSGRSGLALSPDAGRKGPVFALGAVALVAGVGYMGWAARQDAAAVAEQVQVAQSENAQLKGELQQLLTVDQQAAQQEARRGVLVSLVSSRINWERLVRDSMTVIPRGRVSLTKVVGTAPATVTTPAPAPGPGGANAPQTAQPVQGLHLEGLAFTQPDVAQLVSRLEAVPGLGTPRLTSADVVKKGGRWVVNFVIDIPVDQRAQDRATLTTAVDLTAAAQGTAPAGSPAPGGMVP